MRIIVCIKQVPATTTVEIDEKTGVLMREGIETKMNPYDLYALETALKLKEEHGGAVTAVTMGPSQAEEILKESYMMGADDCALLSDKAFAGADVLATGYALSGLVRKLGAFDLIICGRQTTDGDTAQVGAELAEFLDIPNVSNVTRIIHIEHNVIRVETDMGDALQMLDIPLPCLITVEKDIYMPRLPSYRKKLESENKEIQVIGLDDLDDRDPVNYGLDGSPTQVERVFPPRSSAEKTAVHGSVDEIAEFLYQKLKALKFI